MKEHERDALAAYRASVDTKVPEPDRAWERLVGKVEAGAQPLPIDLGPPVRRRAWVWAVAGVAAAAAVVLWAVPRFESAQAEAADTGTQAAYDAEPSDSGVVVSPRSRAPKALVRDARPSLPAEAEPPVAEQPAVEPEEVTPQSPQTGERARTRTGAKSVAKSGAKTVAESGARVGPASGPDVVAEAKALRAVRAALRDGQASRALTLRRRYRARFPKGELRDESTLLRADALCLSGKPEKARTIAKAFVESHARSPLAARARGICADG
jgi:hypothetical protein